MVAMLLVAVLMVGSAGFLARQQIRVFRASRDVSLSDKSDLFTYTRRRLHIRLAGAGVLAAIGITLAVWELAAPLSAANAQRLVSLLITEVLLLFLVAGLDLRETTKTSRF